MSKPTSPSSSKAAEQRSLGQRQPERAAPARERETGEKAAATSSSDGRVKALESKKERRRKRGKGGRRREKIRLSRLGAGGRTAFVLIQQRARPRRTRGIQNGRRPKEGRRRSGGEKRDRAFSVRVRTNMKMSKRRCTNFLYVFFALTETYFTFSPFMQSPNSRERGMNIAHLRLESILHSTPGIPRTNFVQTVCGGI